MVKSVQCFIFGIPYQWHQNLEVLHSITACQIRHPCAFWLPLFHLVFALYIYTHKKQALIYVMVLISKTILTCSIFVVKDFSLSFKYQVCITFLTKT